MELKVPFLTILLICIAFGERDVNDSDQFRPFNLMQQLSQPAKDAINAIRKLNNSTRAGEEKLMDGYFSKLPDSSPDKIAYNKFITEIKDLDAKLKTKIDEAVDSSNLTSPEKDLFRKYESIYLNKTLTKPDIQKQIKELEVANKDPTNKIKKIVLEAIYN
uniref:DUF148 domain-containing protein n=1 Tax=Rhabditophanes sp. KR3021 TaxID=114890 RepID=A0AC35UB73_9BILA